MGPKRDMDEPVNIEGDPEEVLAALLQIDPEEAVEEDAEPDE